MEQVQRGPRLPVGVSTSSQWKAPAPLWPVKDALRNLSGRRSPSAPVRSQRHGSCPWLLARPPRSPAPPVSKVLAHDGGWGRTCSPRAPWWEPAVAGRQPSPPGRGRWQRPTTGTGARPQSQPKPHPLDTERGAVATRQQGTRGRFGGRTLSHLQPASLAVTHQGSPRTLKSKIANSRCLGQHHP